MDKKIVGIKTQLINTDYNLVEPSKGEIIDIDVEDKIEILDIKENIVNFNVIRKLNYKSLHNSYINVTFKTSIKFIENISKEEFCEILKSDVSLLSGPVYSKISLLISNITALSFLGIIVTPPTYNLNNLKIS